MSLTDKFSYAGTGDEAYPAERGSPRPPAGWGIRGSWYPQMDEQAGEKSFASPTAPAINQRINSLDDQNALRRIVDLVRPMIEQSRQVLCGIDIIEGLEAKGEPTPPCILLAEATKIARQEAVANVVGRIRKNFRNGYRSPGALRRFFEDGTEPPRHLVESAIEILEREEEIEETLGRNEAFAKEDRQAPMEESPAARWHRRARGD